MHKVLKKGHLRKQNLMRIDFHVHSEYSHDSSAKISEILRSAKHRGLDAIAITDHDTLDGNREARRLRKPDDVQIIPAVELTLPAGRDGLHLIALNVDEEIPCDKVTTTVRKLKEHGAIIILPHPYRKNTGLFYHLENKNITQEEASFVLENTDYLEALNMKDDIRCIQETLQFATEAKYPVIYGSDAHSPEYVGFTHSIITGPDYFIKRHSSGNIVTFVKGKTIPELHNIHLLLETGRDAYYRKQSANTDHLSFFRRIVNRIKESHLANTARRLPHIEKAVSFLRSTRNIIGSYFENRRILSLIRRIVKDSPQVTISFNDGFLGVKPMSKSKTSQGIRPAKWMSGFTPYVPSQSAKLALQEKADYLRLDWNESTFPPSPLVIKKLKEVVEGGHLNFYPDVTASELRKKISRYVSMDSSFIQVFNGSDAALQAICLTYLDKGSKVLVREPTYTQLYTFVASVGANLVKFQGKDLFDLALEKYHEYLSSGKIKLVYICNPNNPTGVLYEQSTIQQLLEDYPQVLFVIDEAYFEYSKMTVAGLINYQNILITRTFSKAFGLASVRIGYILGLPQLMDNINKVYNRKDVNLLGQVAASAALDDIPYLESKVDEVIRARAWLVNQLKNVGLRVHETPANFILIRMPNASEVVDKLKEKGIFVRDRSYLPQLEGYFRVSIGSIDYMKRVLKAISELLPSNKGKHK